MALPGRLTASLRELLLLPLCALVVTAPLLTSFGWLLNRVAGAMLYDWQRWLEVLALCVTLLLAAALLLIRNKTLVVSHTGFILTLVCFGIGASAVFFYPQDRVVIWRECLMGLALLLLIGLLPPLLAEYRDQTYRLLLSAFAVASVFYVLYFVFWNTSSNVWLFPWTHVHFPGFSNIRYFSDWHSFLLPFFPLAVSFYCRTHLTRILAGLLCSLFYSLLFLAGSRSVLLGHCIGHLVLFLFVGSRYRSFFLRQAVFWLSGWLCFELIRHTLLSDDALIDLVARFANGDLLRGHDRIDLFKYALRLANEHPFMGLGPGRFASLPNDIAAGPHNAVLNIAAEWGWPVAIVVTFALARFFISRARLLRCEVLTAVEPAQRVAADFGLSFYLATIALVSQSLVANVMNGPVSQPCWLLGIVALALLGGTPSTRRANLSPRWCALLLLASALALGGVVAQQFEQVPARNRAYFDCRKPTGFFSPRFWQQGWETDMCRYAPL